MLWLKQSTAKTVQFGPFVDATDGVTLETGLATAMDNATTGIRVSKNGAAFADRNSATAPSYDAMGCYRVELDATDTNTLGTLRIIFEEAATCLPGWMDFMVVEADAYDAFFAAAGTGHIEADAVQAGGTAWGSGAITAGSIASNAITAAKIATDTITADKIAADAIGASELAADAVAEIADGVLDEALAGHATAGTLGKAVTDIEADTNELQTDDVPGLIAALNDVAATDIVSGGAITTSAGAVSNVTLVATTTTNTDMRGTDSAATAAAMAAAQTDLDTLTDARGEPAQGTPAASTTLMEKIDYLYKWMRNKSDHDTTQIQYYADDGTTVDHQRSSTKSGSTVTLGEIESGP